MNNKALIIVDMSNDFVADNGSLTAGKPAQDIVPYIIKTANEFLATGNTVVIAMDSHKENDKHFELWPPHNVIGTWGQQPYGELLTWYKINQFHHNISICPKENYNAFFRTGLAEKLKGRMIDEVHVVGVCTDICDFLTIAGADAEGFKTFAHKNGMATFTNNTEVMLEHMKLCFHTTIVE
ncbi:nicotinamidase/pyrazinamidase [compost metagenome]